MSRKNDYLLHRNGRNQFEVTADDLISRDSVADWPKLEKEFLDKYKDAWLALFTNLNKKQIWQRLFEKVNDKWNAPSLKKFYSQLRDADSTEQYLMKYLSREKNVALKMLGYSENEALSIVKDFNTRYYR